MPHFSQPHWCTVRSESRSTRLYFVRPLNHDCGYYVYSKIDSLRVTRNTSVSFPIRPASRIAQKIFEKFGLGRNNDVRRIHRIGAIVAEKNRITGFASPRQPCVSIINIGWTRTIFRTYVFRILTRSLSCCEINATRDINHVKRILHRWWWLVSGKGGGKLDAPVARDFPLGTLSFWGSSYCAGPFTYFFLRTNPIFSSNSVSSDTVRRVQ